MNYQLRQATKQDELKLIQYSYNQIMKSAECASICEKEEIKKYVLNNVKTKLFQYKIICVAGIVIGTLLIERQSDVYL